MDIRHYSLKFNADPSTKTISGSAYIDLVLTEAAPVLLFDFVSFYKISEVTVNGKKISYCLLRNTLPGVGDFDVKDSNGNDWIAGTCQNEDAKIY